MKNGNPLISGNQHGYIREVNRSGEAVWEINKNDLPGSRSTLCWVGSVPQPEWPTVVQLIEVTRDKTVVWALRDWTTLGPASSTQLLDQPGSADKREPLR